MKVALFITCFNDTLFPNAGKAVVELLERLGCEVEFPLEQTCCGQMHVNSGYEHEAVGLMSRFARVFSGFDAVVSPSASCVAHVRERIPDAPHVFELTEFLIANVPPNPQHSRSFSKSTRSIPRTADKSCRGRSPIPSNRSE